MTLNKKHIIIRRISAAMQCLFRLRVRIYRALFFVYLVIGFTAIQNVYANPVGGQVAAGNAVITQTNNYTEITQSTDKAVINWQSFNIANGERTHFQQPSANAITLNRVNPANGVSNIFGELTATGNIWLINPAGVLFGATAKVDVGGLLVTTANISDEDFINGNYHFVQSPYWHGAVVNEGAIKISDYGLVALVAPGVENRGVIQANLGRVTLAASNEYTIDLYGDQLINFSVGNEITSAAVDVNGNSLKNGVTNSGNIIADGGSVLISAKIAKEVVDNVINMTGYIQARSVMQKNGEIILIGGNQGIVKVTGKLDVSGKNFAEQGGKIKILGEKIGLFDQANIDASGDSGGGEILIGGDYQGKNAAIPNAQYAYVGKEVFINADALNQGNGGKIILWSDKTTRFYGDISAQGGALSGNGGFVETSGKENLDFQGKVNVAAINGLQGTLLLDPRNITVQTGGGATAAAVDQFSDMPSTDLVVDPATLDAVGGNVVLQANNTITFVDALTLNTAGASLTAQAGNSIILQNTISTHGAITLIANEILTAGVSNTDRLTGNAAITMASTASINSDGNPITLQINTGTGLTNNASGSMTLHNINGSQVLLQYYGPTTGNAIQRTAANSVITATSGLGIDYDTAGAAGTIGASGQPLNVVIPNLAIKNADGAIYVNSTQGLTIGGITFGGLTGVGIDNLASGGDLVIAVTGALLSSEAVKNSGTATMSGTVISLPNAANNFNTLGITAVEANVIDVNALDLAASSVTDSYSVTAGGNITQSGALTMTGDANFNAGTGTIGLGLANDFANIGLAASSVNVNDINAINFLSTTVSGALSVTAGGNVTQSNALIVSGLATFDAGANTVTLTNVSNNFSSLGITSAMSATIVDSNAIDLDAANILDDYTVTAGGDITQSGVLQVADDAIFNAGSDDIDLSLLNIFTDIGVTGNSVTVTDATGLNFLASTVSGPFNVIAAGAITQSGALTLSDSAILDAGNNDITLTNASNNFASLGIVAAANATIVDSNGIDLGVTTITNNYTVTAAGNITQTGTLTITGNAIFNAGSNDIDLGVTSNFNNIDVTGRHVTIIDSGGFNFLASEISGVLNVAAGGNVTQSGALTVSNSSVFAIGANSLTLTNASNNFTDLEITAANATIVDSTGINLSTSNITGDYNLTTNGSIAQTAAIVVGGTATLAAGNTNNITLTNASNNFGTVTVTSGNAVAVTDVNAINLGNITADSTINIIAGGAISDSGALSGTSLTANSVGGSVFDSGHTVTSFNAANTGSGNIQLTNTASTLTVTGISQSGGGSVTVNNTGNLTTSGTISSATGGSIALTSTGGTLTLGANLSSGSSLSLSAATGGITLSNSLTLSATNAAINLNHAVNGNRNLTINAGSGTTTFSGAVGNTTALGIGTGAAIILNSTGSTVFNNTVATNSGITAVGPLTFNGNVTLGNGDTASAFNGHVTLAGINFNAYDGATFGNGAFDQLIITTGATSINSTNSDLIFNAAVTNTPALTVNAGAGNITMTSATNFLGILALTGQNVEVINFTSQLLNTSVISGNFTLTANGPITQMGVLTVGGTATFSSLGLQPGGIDITLNNANNNFATVSINSGKNVTLTDINALNLATSTVLGNLLVNTNGAITQSGAITITGGTTTLAAGNTNNITLDNVSNNFSTISITSGNNVTLVDAGALDLAAATVTGTFTVTAGSTITDSGIISANALAINAVGGAILNAGHAINSFTAVNTGLGNITFDNTASNLSVTGITQSGGGDVTINNAGNVNVTGNVNVNNNGSLNLVATGGTLSIQNPVTLTGLGNTSITADNLAITNTLSNVSGTITINASGDIDLGNPNSGMQISGAELQNISATGLTLIAGANDTITVDGITDANSNNISSTLTLNSNGGDINFVNNASQFNVLTTSGRDIYINADLTLDNTLTVNGTGTTYLGADIDAHGSTLTFNTPIVLTNDVNLTDTGTTGILFNDTVNGAHNLTLTATQGDILFNDLVGSLQRLGQLSVVDAVNTIATAAVNADSFTQTQGSSLTSFAAGLNTLGAITINSGTITGSYVGGITSLNGSSGIQASVSVSGLTLNGQNGGNVTGTVAGLAGVQAALQSLLGAGAQGNFYVNGCLLPGATCTSSTPTVPSNQLFIDEPVTIAEDPYLCTPEELADNKLLCDNNDSWQCGRLIEINGESSSQKALTNIMKKSTAVMLKKDLLKSNQKISYFNLLY